MNCAVVATRNEAATIGPLISTLYDYVDHIVVIDESDDRATAYEACKNGAHVLTQSQRSGLGPSLMRGWREAIRIRAHKVVQLDAGGSHDPAHIPDLCRSVADLTIGSRFVPGSEYIGRPMRSRASRVYGYSMYARSGLPVRDWTSGFRVFTREAVEMLLTQEYRANMHGWQAEVLLRAHDLGLNISEYPIRYQAGDSAFRLPHVWEAVKVR